MTEQTQILVSMFDFQGRNHTAESKAKISASKKAGKQKQH